MNGRQGFLFILPAILVLAAFILYPLGSTLYLSMTDQQGNLVGLDNYAAVLQEPLTARASQNTIYYVGVSIVFELILGTVAGILMNQRFRGQGAMRALVLIPWVIPEIVAATVWAWMFHTDFGVINFGLKSIGLIQESVGWLTNPNTVLPALVAIHVWKVFPFVAVMILAGLQGVPASLYEAARVDGATFFDEIRHVMLPALRPVLASITLLLLVNGFNSITIVYATTRGGPANRSLITSIQIYKEAFQYFQFNQASALSLMFFALIGVLIVFYIRWTTTAHV